MRRSPAELAAAVVLAVAAAAPAAAVTPPTSAWIAAPVVPVRAAPDTDAPRIGRLREFRPDRRPTVAWVLGRRPDATGRTWYRVAVPRRPNGTTGYVRGDLLRLRARPRSRIVIHRAARRLEVLRGGRRVLATRVAVGAPGAETPLGDFHVTASFRPGAPVLGRWAIETSAWSRISDWPGGGVVGIHGTPSPWLLGQAVSHGCVRVSDDVVVRVARLAPPGTPVRVIA